MHLGGDSGVGADWGSNPTVWEGYKEDVDNKDKMGEN